MIWLVGWGSRPVDPWEYLGPEAMVAWDRDMAPHMDRMQAVTSIAVFTVAQICQSGTGYRHQVVLHGCAADDKIWHEARMLEDPIRWISTFRPSEFYEVPRRA